MKAIYGSVETLETWCIHWKGKEDVDQFIEKQTDRYFKSKVRLNPQFVWKGTAYFIFVSVCVSVTPAFIYKNKVTLSPGKSLQKKNQF